METQLQTMITEDHLNISNRTIDKVITLLGLPGLQVVNYAVNTESWQKGETIKLKTEDGRSIEVRIILPN